MSASRVRLPNHHVVYEQYYASLEAASRVHSTSQTPRMDSVDSDFDEEERKPNVQYLDALNNVTRKRSRSIEDYGDRNAKAIRSTNGTPCASQSSSAHNSGMNSVVDTPSPPPEIPSVDVATMANDVSVDISMDDPMVFGESEFVIGRTSYLSLLLISVGGEPMPFSQVTQEIADERMSPEEYTAWYEIMMMQG